MSDRAAKAAEHFIINFKAEWEKISLIKNFLLDKNTGASTDITSLLEQICSGVHQVSGLELQIIEIKPEFDIKGGRVTQIWLIQHRSANFHVSVKFADDRAIYRDQEFSIADTSPLLLAVAHEANEHFRTLIQRDP